MKAFKDNEFAETLREQLKMNTQEFHDLFSMGKNPLTENRRQKHEITKIKNLIDIVRSGHLDIKI